MKLHCDKCKKELGTYLYGKGGIEEIAHIGALRQIGLPDVICFKCFNLITRIKNTTLDQEFKH